MRQLLAEMIKPKITYITPQGNKLSELTKPGDVYNKV